MLTEANHFKKLRREAITKNVNKVMRAVSNRLPGQLNITSHSFRIGYITQLWKDSKDIEFVKQSIGHRTLETTSAYVTKLSDQVSLIRNLIISPQSGLKNLLRDFL